MNVVECSKLMILIKNTLTLKELIPTVVMVDIHV